MRWHIEFPVKALDEPAGYQDKIMLAGSCFAEHIGRFLDRYKLEPLINPQGILYNPLSIARSLEACLENKKYAETDLFFDHGLWHSWDHHERFSGSEAQACLEAMNALVAHAHQYLSTARWLIISLGTAGVYHLKQENKPVANCHKRPASDFDFRMMTPPEIIALLDGMIHRLFLQNTRLKIIFTVSPVRYIRHGLAENNLSKSTLLYAVHHLVNKFDRLYYFPAYEIVVDELRDYRFYDEDMVHPNAQAIQYVWDKFAGYFLSDAAQKITREIHPVWQAAQHRPLHADSAEYQKFVQQQLKKIAALETRYPFLDFEKEKSGYEGKR